MIGDMDVASNRVGGGLEQERCLCGQQQHRQHQKNKPLIGTLNVSFFLFPPGRHCSRKFLYQNSHFEFNLHLLEVERVATEATYEGTWECMLSQDVADVLILRESIWKFSVLFGIRSRFGVLIDVFLADLQPFHHVLVVGVLMLAIGKIEA